MAEDTGRRRWRFWGAFKDIAIIFSFVMNFVLLMVLLLSPGPIFQAKSHIAEPLLADMDRAFAGLGETDIISTVHINEEPLIKFDLPIRQNIAVTLTEPVPLQVPATFFLPGGGGSINGTVYLKLPPGMRLPIDLQMTVPVSENVPITMSVPVTINLNEGGLEPAIIELRNVFSPINATLQSLPDSLEEILRPNE
ncbi:MAG: hypothetical protein ACP5HM_05100 [Anaerolineae bacterium]